MIVATRFGNRKIETRSGEWGTEHIIPSPDGYGAMTAEAAAGLPAVGAAIRLITHTIASLHLCVYEGEDAEKRKREDSWQYRLFEYPNDEASRFTFFADIVSAIESCGNAFVFKGRMVRSKQVGAMVTLHPKNMTVRRDYDTGELVYEYWDGKRSRKLNPADVLHIRGDTLGGGDIGFSPIAVHRASLGTFISRERFEGKHYQNDARPGVVLQFPGDISQQKAKEWVDYWDSRHAGPENRGKTAAIGGAEVKLLPINLEEQQFVESQKFSVQEVARMFGVPAVLLEEGEFKTSEEESLRFLKFCIGPRLERIEAALMADSDLFGPAQSLYPEYFIDDFLRADAVSMAQVAHQKVQSGIWLLDEARAKEGLPPLPDGAGQVPQIVPVGGQANPGSPPPEE